MAITAKSLSESGVLSYSSECRNVSYVLTLDPAITKGNKRFQLFYAQSMGPICFELFNFQCRIPQNPDKCDVFFKLLREYLKLFSVIFTICCIYCILNKDSLLFFITPPPPKKKKKFIDNARWNILMMRKRTFRPCCMYYIWF